jgi:hypothetical protein
VRGYRKEKLCDGGEVKMLVASGGALGRDRGKEEEKLWCGES